MAFTYCYLGAEQLFVRFSKVASEKTYISSQVSCYMLVYGSFYTLSSTILISGYIYSSIDHTLPLIVSLLVAITVFNYHYYRVNKSFLISQLALGHWKALLPISILLSIFISYESSLILVLCIAFLFLLLSSYNVIKNLEITKERHNDMFLLSIGFGFSLLVLLF